MIRGFILSLAAISFSFLGAGCTSQDNSTNPMAHASGNIVDVVTAPGMDQMTTFVTALKSAALLDTLKAAGPLTVFAPTNAAFDKLPAGTLDDLLKPENKEKLRKILLYHVVLGRHDASELHGMTELNTIDGLTLKLAVTDNRQTVGNSKATAHVIRADINATNGVIHWVDTVLMP